MAPPKGPALFWKRPFTSASKHLAMRYWYSNTVVLFGFCYAVFLEVLAMFHRSVRLFSPRDQCCLHRMEHVAHVHETLCIIQLQVNNSE